MDFSIMWKKYFILCSLFFLSFGTYAQQNHFIYLQTENSQLFYVKINGQVKSSSSAGYLILPALPDGALQLTVGFPRNEFPEEKFDLSINNKNEGFLLKNMNEKGWVLFNLQSLAIIEKSSIEKQVVVAQATTKEDAFSSLLANAVNDSSLFQHNNTVENVIQQQPAQVSQVIPQDSLSLMDSNVKPAETRITTQLQANNDEKSIHDSAANKIIVSSVPAGNDDRIIGDSVSVTGEDAVTKILDVNQSAGMDMIYTVKKPTGEDTVRIFLPATDANKSSEPATSVTSNNAVNKLNDSTLTITPTIVPPDYKSTEQLPTKDSVVFSITMADSAIVTMADSAIVKSDSLQEKNEVDSFVVIQKVDEPVPAEVSKTDKAENEIILLPQVVTSSEVNSDCNSFATHQDFLKVRKKMASVIGRDNMIEAAKKFFKSKCYSTEQIRNLSFLFLTDEGKYLFFDMAYAFTSDSNLYETLQSQFKDPYFLNRFKAIIRE